MTGITELTKDRGTRIHKPFLSEVLSTQKFLHSLIRPHSKIKSLISIDGIYNSMLRFSYKVKK